MFLKYAPSWFRHVPLPTAAALGSVYSDPDPGTRSMSTFHPPLSSAASSTITSRSALLVRLLRADATPVAQEQCSSRCAPQRGGSCMHMLKPGSPSRTPALARLAATRLLIALPCAALSSVMRTPPPFATLNRTVTPGSSTAANAVNCSSSSSRLSSSSAGATAVCSVCSPHSALDMQSAATCTEPATHSMVRSYSCSRNAQFATLDPSLWMVRMSHLRLLWSVRTMTRAPDSMCRQSLSAVYTPKHSWSRTLQPFSMSLNLCDPNASALCESGSVSLSRCEMM